MIDTQGMRPGHKLGRDELLVPIAQGGMATIWAARLRGPRGFSKMVAVKAMLPSLGDDPQFEQMFLAEAKLAARIRPPNVCEIFDLGEQDGVLYIAMEWIEGEPLGTLQRAAAKRSGVPLARRTAMARWRRGGRPLDRGLRRERAPFAELCAERDRDRRPERRALRLRVHIERGPLPRRPRAEAEGIGAPVTGVPPLTDPGLGSAAPRGEEPARRRAGANAHSSHSATATRPQ